MATVDHAPRTADEQIGRSATMGAILGFFGVSLAVAVLGIVIGQHPGASLALGVFVGLFGGLGFGAMMGASVATNRADAAGGRR
jgi:hypothetical protein